MNKSFGDGFKLKDVFLDISKAFDKTWHEGQIFKLKKKKRISRKLFEYKNCFLRFENMKSGTQRIIFILGKYYCEVSQRSILGPVFFLIDINQSNDLSSNPNLFTDDTSLFQLSIT